MNAKLATVLAIGTIAAGMVWIAHPVHNGVPTKPPPPPDVTRLQQLADEACLCQQRGQGEDCGKSYKQAIAAYEVGEAISACAPIGTSTDVITYGGKEFWIRTGYHVVANLPKGMSTRLCRTADAQAIEAAYAKGFGPRIDWKTPISQKELNLRDRAANAEGVKTLEAINRGDGPLPKGNGGGCA